MGIAYTLSVRESVISLHETGINMLSIAIQTGISYGTVKTLVKRYKAKGKTGLNSHYNQCGRTRTYESERSYRLVRLYRYHHPTWGVEYILMKIRAKYPDLPLCVSRIYERRLRTNDLVSMPKNPPLQNVHYPERARLPHDSWQIDAKENIKTLDGQPACYLTTTDEKTGGALAAKVFPLRSHQSSSFRRCAAMPITDVPPMGLTRCRQNGQR